MRKPKIKPIIDKVGSTIKKAIRGLRGRNVAYDGNIDNYKQLSGLAYKSIGDRDSISSDASKLGYNLDTDLSNDETKVFVNPNDKKAVVAYRGTQLNRRKSAKKDLISDAAILFGAEKHDKRFKEANSHFQNVKDKYKDFQLDTTGHSLGGQLAKYVTDKNLDKVNKNVNFNRGSGLFEPFRKKSNKTIDVSNKNDIISATTRLQGGKHTIEKKNKGLLGSHSLKNLFSNFKN